MLSDLAIVAFQALQSVEGIVVTITRGQKTCSPTVVFGRTDSQALTTREATYAADAQDVLILATDYTPTSYNSPSPPQDGDKITVKVSGETLTLDVRPPGDNQQCFTRWRGNGVYRVHTKIHTRVPSV